MLDETNLEVISQASATSKNLEQATVVVQCVVTPDQFPNAIELLNGKHAREVAIKYASQELGLQNANISNQPRPYPVNKDGESILEKTDGDKEVVGYRCDIVMQKGFR